MSKINPTNKPMKKVTFKFNIFWMYAIIVAFLAGMYFLNNNSNTLSKEVSLDEFNKYVAVDQGISNIVINDDNSERKML